MDKLDYRRVSGNDEGEHVCNAMISSMRWPYVINSFAIILATEV